MQPMTVVVAPTAESTRLLAMAGPHEMLRAKLGPAAHVHRWAASTLLEGLALWHQEPLRVVLYAESEAIASPLMLTDGLGFGYQTFHFEIEVVDRRPSSDAQRLRGVGDFRDLREIAQRVVP
jgi:hypothetical protein